MRICLEDGYLHWSGALLKLKRPMEDLQVMGSTRRQHGSRVSERMDRLARLGSPSGFSVIIALASFLCSLVFMAGGEMSAAPAPRAQASKWVAQLPDGNGKSIVVAKCQFCHTLERVLTSSRTKGDWDDLVQLMISRGAPLSSEDTPTVVDYLAANFGPGSQPPAAQSGDPRAGQ